MATSRSFKDQPCHHCGNADLDIIQNPDNKKYYMECIDCEARGPEGKTKTDAQNLWRKDDKAKVSPPKPKGEPQSVVDGLYQSINDRITRRRNQLTERQRDGLPADQRRIYNAYIDELYLVMEDFVRLCDQHRVRING